MKSILFKLFPSLIFSTASIALMIADAALYKFMDIIKENGKYAISFACAIYGSGRVLNSLCTCNILHGIKYLECM